MGPRLDGWGWSGVGMGAAHIPDDPVDWIFL